jgi:hypothetical protein
VSDTAELRDRISDPLRKQQDAEAREAAVRDVVQTVAQSTFDLDDVLQTVIDRTVHLSHADHGNIARLG